MTALSAAWTTQTVLPQRSVASRRSRFAASGFDVVSWLTLYLVVLFAIPSRLVFQPLGSAGAPSMLLGLGSLALWFLLLITRGRLRRRQVPATTWALVVFVACIGVSYVLAMTRALPSDEVSPADVAIISLMSWTGTLLLTQDAMPSRRRFDILVWRFALAGGVIAAIGLAQFFLRLPLVDLISIPGLTPVGDSVAYVRNGLVRPSGTAIHPIEYGALLAIILPIALHVGIYRKDHAPVVRWVPAAAIAVVIAVSSSRSAYIGAAIALCICFFTWSPAVQRRVLLVLVSGLMALAVAVPRLYRSVTGLFAGVEDDPSITSRTDSFGLAWSFLLEHPLFGRGLGTFLPKYRIFDNQYLGLLVGVGVVGTVAFLLVGVCAVALAWSIASRRSDPLEGNLAVSLAASVVVGYVGLAFFDGFAFPMTMGVLFLSIGMIGALWRTTVDKPGSAFID